MLEYSIVQSPGEYAAAADLFSEYAAWLGIDLSFQKFHQELLELKSMYAPPYGGIILAKMDNEYVGCIAVRKIEPTIAELKRMYVKPVYQKKGIGNNLLEMAIAMAKEFGYKKLRLDTLDTMQPAMNLYYSHGFYKIPPYYFNPEKNAVFFEKEL